MSPSARRTGTEVYVEAGAKKAFACAVAWPGWCRAGRTEEQAIEELTSYAPRYAVVAKEAGVRFPASAGDGLVVVERVTGTATTDFGAPGAVPRLDAEPTARPEAGRHSRLVAAAWQVLDRVAAEAPDELRKGPRGGGRDRDKMLQHVVSAEAAYARKLGIRHKEPALDDRPAIEALRAEILRVLRRPSDGAPLVERGWPARYAARRIAWHVLDHVWEMEDRSEPGG